MTAKEIINCLTRSRYARNFVLPNYTPAHWWECDAFCVTGSGYSTEFEVKVSRADFLIDSKKERERRTGPYGSPRVVERKHEMLAMGDVRGPSRFYYVVPDGLVTEAEVPTWAGLIYIKASVAFRDIISGVTTPARLYESEKKGAPRLHKAKVDDEVMKHARGVCYWRLHHLLNAQNSAAA